MSRPSGSGERRIRFSTLGMRVRQSLASNEAPVGDSSLDDESIAVSKNPPATMSNDDLLTCSICLERYQDNESNGRQPKILPCFHTFCKKCLEQMVQQQKSQLSGGGGRPTTGAAPIRAIISCPQCRRLIAIPNGGPAAFQTNFYILQMNDLMKEVTRTSSGASLPIGPSDEPGVDVAVGQGSTPAQTIPVAEDNETCTKHSKWPLLFYCKKCSLRICSNCTVLDHKESEGHIIVDLQVVLDQAMNEINDKVSWAETVVQTSKSLIQKGQMELTHLNVAEDTVCVRINRMGEAMAKVLATRLRKLQDSVRAEMLGRRQAIRNETCDLIDMTRTLEKKRREISERSAARQANWVLEGKAQTEIDEMTDMAKKLQDSKLEPRYFLLFDESALDEAEMQRMCENLIPTPQRRQMPAAIELRFCKATAGQLSQVSTVLKDGDGNVLSSEEYPLSLTVVDPEGESISKCKTTFKSESGCYDTVFLASQFGDYSAEAELNGFPLECRDLSFTANSNEPIAVVGERGSEDGKFNKPVSVLVSPDDEALLVAEFENQRIQIFDPNTFVFKSKFSVAGEGRSYPGSIAIFNAGSYREVVCPKVEMLQEGHLAADTIQIFDMNTGLLVTSFQNKLLKKALHVAVNSCGRIIVSDRDANGLFVFNREGALLGRIGRQGSAPGQFNCPVFVAVGLNDDILVADSANNRVQILDKTGVFKTELGASGRGKLGAPAGITVDRYGNILVADSQSNRVQMYTKDGQYLATLQPRENAFNRPRGVATWATDGTKRLFVIDRGNHSVKTLSYM